MKYHTHKTQLQEHLNTMKALLTDNIQHNKKQIMI